MGKTEVRMIVQKDSMDDILRNRLFNVTKELIDDSFVISDGYTVVMHDFLVSYCDYFGEKITSHRRTYNPFLEHLEYKIFVNNDVWFFYDFIEWLMSMDLHDVEYFHDKFNRIFEEEKSAYRLNVANELIPLTDDIEINEVNESIEKSARYKSVSEHLNNARASFSSRGESNYLDVIRESVFAIEALAKIIVKDKNATLETALKKIPNINPNLQASLLKLYHFRGDQGGVGHAVKEHQESNITEYEAKLLLIMAHAVTNYLIANFLKDE